MGTCLGISSDDKERIQNPVLERTISQSTNLTGNSATSEQNTLTKSVVKRYVHKNKRSHIAYFHDNPLLKPLVSNKLYMQRKPDAITKMISSMQITKAIEIEEKSDSKPNGINHLSNLKDRNNVQPIRSNKIGLKPRSYSTHQFSNYN